MKKQKKSRYIDENIFKMTVKNHHFYQDEKKKSLYEKIENFLSSEGHQICGCRKAHSLELCQYFFYDNSILSLLGDPYSPEIELNIFPKESHNKSKISTLIKKIKKFSPEMGECLSQQSLF